LPHQENESLKQLYELNKEIKQIMEKKQGKVMMEKEIYHETYFFLAQFEKEKFILRLNIY